MKSIINRGTLQIPVDSFQETSGDTQAVAQKTVNYFWPVLKGADFSSNLLILLAVKTDLAL